MKPRTKCAIYIALALCEPLTKSAAVCVEKNEWPNQFELVALALGMMYLGLLTLKAWSSDPSKQNENS